ncbi:MULTISPECIES: hypothetical protein [Providencia]|uniref:hypothetical protein n=1 Tax=Providencia TaxID=586 RepID=UPI001E643379|nr:MULTISPECIES: hypothetical protein [Providencia]MCX9125431.1 hypothetical protein [Providencia rettgeri]MCX9130036.1 hypothetical protein [Providencia rettgeri]UEK61652.1 hypothetical protein LL668_20415 [Providencia rettgeri]
MFKKSYLYIGLMMIFTSSQSIADEFEIDYDQQIIKLNQRINELEKKKSDLEKKNKEKIWNVESYLGTEQEIDSDDNWKFLKGSVATSPYFGAFIYQNNSLWMYDIQVLKTYLDNNSEYDRTRWQVGATRTFPFTFHDKPGNFKLRLGYRNDNWHYASISNPALAAPQYKGDIRKGEERHEIWVRPQFNYKYSDNISFNGSLSFRFIDRKLDYARAKGEYGVYKRNWSSIDEHFIGGTYTFNKKNSLWVNYLYIDENLINTLHNNEHFLWAVYRYRFDNGLMIMPYTRYALTKGKQSFRDSNNQEFLFKEKDRSRYGFQLLYPITNGTSIFWDTYYRPEVTWTKGTKENNNFWFWAIELRHTF